MKQIFPDVVDGDCIIGLNLPQSGTRYYYNGKPIGEIQVGYAPGGRDQAALSALAFVYTLVPCVLKLAACAALVWFKRSK
jgi:hypothetical protein